MSPSEQVSDDEALLNRINNEAPSELVSDDEALLNRANTEEKLVENKSESN